jgi:hypothetical protein
MDIGQTVQSGLKKNFRIYVPPGVKRPEGVPVDTERPTLDPVSVFETTCGKGKGDVADMNSNMIEYHLKDPRIVIVRGFDKDGTLRGFLLGRVGTHVFHIEILCSSLAGYGTMLETIAQGTALANGNTKIALTPLPSAEPFYKKLEYGRIKEYPHMMGKHIETGGKRKTRRRKTLRRKKQWSRSRIR